MAAFGRAECQLTKLTALLKIASTNEQMAKRVEANRVYGILAGTAVNVTEGFGTCLSKPRCVIEL